MKRILKPVTYILAAIYFLVDAVFMAVARPMARWIGRHFEFKWLRTWIRSLSPYPSLALFSVPVIILEPIKPVAAHQGLDQRPGFNPPKEQPPASHNPDKHNSRIRAVINGCSMQLIRR